MQHTPRDPHSPTQVYVAANAHKLAKQTHESASFHILTDALQNPRLAECLRTAVRDGPRRRDEGLLTGWT